MIGLTAEIESLESITEGLRAVQESAFARLPASSRRDVHYALTVLPDWRVARDVGDVGQELLRLIEASYGELGSARDVDLFGIALTAGLGTVVPRLLQDRPVPPDVLDLVPAALGRLLAFLRDGPSGYRLGNDHFLKDLRFASGLSVPCGAQVVDLRGLLSRRQGLRLARARQSPVLVRPLLVGRAPGPWLNPHTESRYLDEFNEVGWDACYARMASLLRMSPEVKGVAATSWFYDPALEQISPRLAYLRQRPLERGALLVEGTTSEFDIANATATSATRRDLHRRGAYTPKGHTLVWLRADLLRWAEQWRAGATRPPAS